MLYRLSYASPTFRPKPTNTGPARHYSHKTADGAGDETRTRDPQLGRLMLYQLSYTRPKYLREYTATSPLSLVGRPCPAECEATGTRRE